MDKQTLSLLEAALLLIEDRMAMAYWNTHEEEMVSPFRNTGQSMDYGLFQVCAYDWENEQPYNFQYGDIRIKWYKHFRNCLEVNRPISQSEITRMLAACLRCIDAHDIH